MGEFSAALNSDKGSYVQVKQSVSVSVEKSEITNKKSYHVSNYVSKISLRVEF